MRRIAMLLLVAAPLAGASALIGPQAAEAAQRNCQTLLTCNFSKNGSYRGCLSSYSCRQCRFVSSRCRIGNATGSCQKLVCGWGG